MLRRDGVHVLRVALCIEFEGQGKGKRVAEEDMEEAG